MLLLSRYPIDANSVRSFQHFRWADMPDALAPKNPATGTAYYPDAVWQQLRLSSKSHWDVPIQTPLGVVHFLISHRSEEHTSELQSLMRISYAVFCLKKKK